MQKQAKSKSVKMVVSKATIIKGGPRNVVQEALQITWVLNGVIKRDRMSYLRIGKMLTDVHHRNLHGALKHPDMEDYAQKRLGLGRASLYRYLQTYDWVLKNHPEWLQPKPKGFIPDLYDCVDLKWIENELERKDLVPATKAALAELQKKGLSGDLKKGEVNQYRKRTKPNAAGVKSFISNLQRLCRRGADIKGVSAGVLATLDSAIAQLEKENP